MHYNLALAILKYQFANCRTPLPSRKEFWEWVATMLPSMNFISDLSERHVLTGQFLSGLYVAYATSLADQSINGNFPFHPKEADYNDRMAHEVLKFLIERGTWGQSYTTRKYLCEKSHIVAKEMHLDPEECRKYLNSL
jgi:hypothetical protein